MSVISVSAGSLPVNYAGPETDLKLRIYCRRQFLTSDLDLIMRGGLHTEDFYLEVDCDVSGTTINHDAFDIDSTEDGTPASSWYLFAIYTAAGAYIGTAYKKLRIPDSPTPRTLASIALYNQAVCAELPNTYYTAAMIDDILDALTSTAQKATELVYGVVKLSFAAADVADPIAMSHNDPLMRQMRETYYLESFGHDEVGLQEFLDEIEDNPAELLITDNLDIAVETNIDIPVNVLVRYAGNAKITVGTDSRIRIYASEIPGNRQYFYGEGDVYFGRGALPWFNTVWWTGVVADNDTNYTAQIARAFQTLVYQGENHGGGILYWGAGDWRVAELTLPKFGTIIGAGRDPDAGSYGAGASNGTVVRPFGEPECVFRLQEANRMSTLINFTVTQNPGFGDAADTSDTFGILAEGDTNSGFSFRAERMCFQGVNNGVPIIKFALTATNHWETVNNVFDHCWLQVGENQTGLFINTVNSTWTMDSWEVQVSAGGTAFKSEGRGWWVEIMTDARGAGPITSMGKTDHRSIASASVERTADDLENDFYSTITLDPSTPAEDQFIYNDIGQDISFNGGFPYPGFNAHVVEFISPFQARLSYHPIDGDEDPYDINDEPCTVHRWNDPVGPAHAVRHFEGGNMKNTLILGGIDEGFNYSLIYGGDPHAMVEMRNYTAQAKIKITSAANITLSGTYQSCGIMDESSGPVVIVNLDNGTFITDDAGRNIFTKNGYVFGKFSAGETHNYFTRRPFDNSIRKHVANSLETYAQTNPFRRYHNIIYFDGQWGQPDGNSALAPLMGLAATNPAPAGDDDQKRMLRFGKIIPLTEAWEDYYDMFYSDYTHLLEVESTWSEAETPVGGMVLRDLPFFTSRVAIYADEIRAGKVTGIDYEEAVCGTVTQITSNATAVTLNKIAGSVAVVNNDLTAGSQVTFRVNNTKFINFKQFVDLRIQGDAAHAFSVRCTDAGTSFFDVTIKNESTGTVGTNITVLFIIRGMTWT